MLVWKKILWLRERIREQKAWIERAGGDLTGYIERYGDPSVPPLHDGKPKTFIVAEDRQDLFSYLVRVPDTKNEFYAPHSGNGGTKIYEADVDRLQSWEQELTDLELRNHAARQKADEKAEIHIISLNKV